MNDQAKILAALVVEDMESDAQLLVRMLKKAGYELVYEQVETAGQMRAALKKRPWDIIISDYRLPQFSGEGALEILKETGLDIPFIIVSGTMGEETAVAMMKAGAQDYLMKDDLARLIPAVARELEQAEIRQERKKAQEQLLLQGSALNAAANAIVITDREGTIEWANPAFTVLTGYTFEDVVGRNPRDLLKSGKHDQSFYQRMWETILAGEVWHGELINRRKDGVFYTEEETITPLKNADGTIGHFIAIKQDVSARKQAEQALAASEAELRALFASMRDVVLVIDRQGLYRKIAPTNHDLLVQPAEKLLGKKLHDIFPAERADFFVSTIQQVLDSGQTSQIEYELLIGNQTIWFETSISPMDQDSTLWVARNITQRKQTENALAASEAELRALVEQVPTIVYTESAETRETQYISPQVEKITGYTPAEWMEDRDMWKKMVHPQDLAALLAEDERTNATHEPFYVEYRILTRDGRTVWLHDEALMIQDQDGKPLFWQGVMYDITERKRAEELLQQSQTNLLSALRVAHMGHWEFDISMQMFTFNDQYYSLHGTNAQEAGGYQISAQTFAQKYVHPEDAHTVGHAIQQAIEATDPNFQFQIEARIMRKDGEPRWVTVWFRIEKDVQGRTIKMYGVNQDITERKQAEENIHQRVRELEVLYQSGLALSQLLNPKEIGGKIIELLKEKLNWHHTAICLYNSQDDSLKLLDFNQPGLESETEKRAVEEYLNRVIARSGHGLTGWALQQSRAIRSGDVTSDPHYIETYPGIRSGLYIPMKLGDRKIGVIDIESEQPNAFSEADEQLIVTLANQAASALENARLFEETRHRVMELETLNRISLVLRSVSKPDELLSIVLEEALAILNTSHGSIVLHNRTTGNLEKTIARGWNAKVTEEPQASGEGIAGKVFTSGEIYISREFASDPETRDVSRSQMPPGWGGACLPIRTSQRTLGVMIVSVPSERELDKDKIRLLSILSEMTGAALQRMQLHEQTVHRLEQLNALRAVDQAISSSRDMHLTFNILLTHTISQLNVDATDVLLFYPGSNTLELVASQGFHTLLVESASLSDSFAGRAIVEHRSIMTLDFETAKQNPQFGKLWKEEGFVCYWCVPLIVKGEVKGVLEVYRRSTFTPDAEWIEFLEALAGQAAIAIDNTQLFENLQRANMDLGLAYDATIEGWSRAMDMRDHETEGHTLRVTDLTLKLARAMRVSESQLIAIRRGALLHDIGKMGVPDAILLKDGKLTDEEWAIMRQHPQFARDMLLPIAYLNDAINIPYCHHEKWDGTGYPQGLKGDHIPIAARIFAVVDVWDALTNDRTYRKKWAKQKALQYIREQSGKHFDPRVVDIFLNNIGKIS